MLKKKDIKTFLILFSILSTFIIFMIFSYQYLENKKWNEKNKKEIVGEIINYRKGAKGHKNAVIKYVVSDSSFYKTLESSFIIGDRLPVIYDISNPQNARIKKESPLFLTNEKTEFCVGKLLLYDSFIFNSMEFCYYVNGKYYTRRYYQDSKIKNSSIKEGCLFHVEYSKNRPYISIIHLDKPIQQLRNDWWYIKINSLNLR